jgi:hypothetical protein
MKIPKTFQKLEDGEVLLIVSGKQGAAFYHLHGESIDLVDNFKIDKPEYTDFEGEFKVRGRGITVSSGSIKESDDQGLIRQFLKELKHRFSGLKFAVSKIYLLAPPQTKNKIKAALPAESRDKVEKVVSGNFSRFHPIQLLERVYGFSK